jgi:hypothetical protein
VPLAFAALVAGCAHEPAQQSAGPAGSSAARQRVALHHRPLPRPEVGKSPLAASNSSKTGASKSGMAKPVPSTPRSATADEAAKPAAAGPASDVATVSALPSPQAGRTAAIPLPDQALLQRQPPPECDLKTMPSAPTAEEVRIAALSHERGCYKEVEALVRRRLDVLQDAVGITIQAVESRSKGLAHTP